MTGDPVADQADAVLRVLETALPPGTLVAAYLYGSATASGLRADSDFDVFAIVHRRLTDVERRAVLDGLLPISGRGTRPVAWRPVELTIVVHDEVRPWRYPPRVELQYGEWLREAALAGTLEPSPASPDVAILLRMVLDRGRSLLGPPPAAVLDAVPAPDVARAMLDEIQPLLADLEHDTRNVLLTLVRMWSTLATGDIRSKDAAVDWALPLMPVDHRPILVLARDAYLGTVPDGWEALMPSARAIADAIVARIRALPPADASV